MQHVIYCRHSRFGYLNRRVFFLLVFSLWLQPSARSLINGLIGKFVWRLLTSTGRQEIEFFVFSPVVKGNQIFWNELVSEDLCWIPVNGMANQCHLYHRGHQGAVGFLLSIVILVGCSNCAAYTIRNYRTNKAQLPGADGTSVESSPSDSQVDIDRFYFPTDEGLREFQQILLRELGLTKVPDLSKVNLLDSPTTMSFLFCVSFVSHLMRTRGNWCNGMLM